MDNIKTKINKEPKKKQKDYKLREVKGLQHVYNELVSTLDIASLNNDEAYDYFSKAQDCMEKGLHVLEIEAFKDFLKVLSKCIDALFRWKSTIPKGWVEY